MIYQYRVSFSEVDYARVLFFGRYYYVVNRGFEEWMHQHGLYYLDLVPNHNVRIPIVASYCRYLRPAYMDDVLEVHLGVKDLTPRGFRMPFAFYRQGDERLLAWGYLERRFVSGDGEARDAPEWVLRTVQTMADESRNFVENVWAPLAAKMQV